MRATQAFWDTSAVVPLCVQEEFSTLARRTARQYSRQVVWWGTWAEARGALARALRNDVIVQANKLKAQAYLTKLRAHWQEIPPTVHLRELAVSLLDAHPLRTADALQLAAALAWCKEKPRHRAMISFDDQLAEVATLVGFDVIRP